MNTKPAVLFCCGLALLATACALLGQSRWTEEELAVLEGLWIGSLPPLPADPSNRYADDHEAAVLGQKLFFDTRFSSNGQVSCATCHLPDRLFQDGMPLAKGLGTTNRRTMTIIGTAYSPWQFWDGRKDSQWAQALGPLENPVEHGGNRIMYAHIIQEHYAGEYEAIFGPLPDLSHLPPDAGPIAEPTARAAWDAMSDSDQQAVTRIYANLGKAIAAYERRLLPGPSRFDRYVEALLKHQAQTANELLSADEVAGLKLFIGDAHCINCHNGPLFTNNAFHNTGVPAAPNLPEDSGRALGVQQVLADEFNCLSAYSDAQPEQCVELNFLTADDEKLVRQFKPPSLRNAAGRGPYMHAGQFATLEEVLQHYNTAPDAPAGHTELEPLDLTEKQMMQIIAFLKTLDGPINADPEWQEEPERKRQE